MVSGRGDVTWRLRSLLQVTKVTYVTETFPFSQSLRVMYRHGTDKLGSLPKHHGCCTSSAPLSKPPDFPSGLLGLEDRRGLTQRVYYLLFFFTHTVRLLDTLGKHALSRDAAESTSCPQGVIMWRLHIWTGSTTLNVFEVAPVWLGGSQHRQELQSRVCQGKDTGSPRGNLIGVEYTHGITIGWSQSPLGSQQMQLT